MGGALLAAVAVAPDVPAEPDVPEGPDVLGPVKSVFARAPLGSRDEEGNREVDADGSLEVPAAVNRELVAVLADGAGMAVLAVVVVVVVVLAVVVDAGRRLGGTTVLTTGLPLEGTFSKPRFGFKAAE